MGGTSFGDDSSPAGRRGDHRPRLDRQSALRIAPLFLPVLLISWSGWQRRWMCDDAFINFRIVKQMLAGHGPVFNIGERVEAGTSPLWLVVLAALDALTPIPIEWIAVLASIAAVVGGLTFAMLGTRRALLALGVTGTFLPLGALVYAVLPPAWDFATSGLEVGLGVFWLGLSWWLLTGRLVGPGADARAPWKPWWVPVVLGLGPLVRPDFLIYSAGFLLALLLVAGMRAGWRAHLAALALAAALPFVTELFRMGYYGSVVPNTAIAKEGSLANWSTGWHYLRDFVGPYRLVLPFLVLAGLFLVPLAVGAPRRALPSYSVFGLTIVAGLVHALYVIRVGGDYMHGRMLVPALFVLLLPFSVVAARGWQWVAVAAVIIWAVASATVLRTPYSASRPRLPESVGFAFDAKHLISDERLVQIRLSSMAHPITLGDFARKNYWAAAGYATRALILAGHRGLLLTPDTQVADSSALIPTRADVRAPIVAFVGAVGVYAYASGNSTKVVDLFGIVDWMSAHQKLDGRKRPGHEKFLPSVWMFARYAESGAPIPSGVSPVDVQAAGRALACGDFPELIAAAQAPLGVRRVLDNVAHSFSLSRFRFNGVPEIATSELCGS